MKSGITVIMAVYHAEKGVNLASALDSIWRQQTLRPKKIILIEDGQLTPELYSVIDKFKGEAGEAFEVYANEHNRGLAYSLNKALDHVATQYIARMDSDDISLAERFSKQKEYLDSHPEISVVGSSIEEFNSVGQKLNTRHYPLSPEHVRKSIHKASPLAHPSVMMRAEPFNNGLRYSSRYGANEDIALWFDVLKRDYKIANMPEVLLRFRRDDDGYRRRNRAKAIGEFKAYFQGITSLHGKWSLLHIWPCARLCARLMPTSVIKAIYKSNLRKTFLEQKQ